MKGIARVLLPGVLGVGMLVGCGHTGGCCSQPGKKQVTVEEQRPGEAFKDVGTEFYLVGADGKHSKVIFGYNQPTDRALLRVDGAAQKVRQVAAREVKRAAGQDGAATQTVEVWKNDAVELEIRYWKSGSNEAGDLYAGWMVVKRGASCGKFKIAGRSGC